MILVCGSSPKYCRKSTSSRSSLFPMLANLARPTCSSMRKLSIMRETPPLWDMIDISPGGALNRETKGRHRPLSVLATVTPLGPTKRMPCLRAASRVLSARDFPSSLNSANPPVGMAMRLIPILPQRSTMSGTNRAGIRQYARSGTSGRSSRSLNIRIPSTWRSSALGFTPKSLPRYPQRSRFSSVMRGIFAGFEERPMIAIDSG